MSVSRVHYVERLTTRGMHDRTICMAIWEEMRLQHGEQTIPGKKWTAKSMQDMFLYIHKWSCKSYKWPDFMGNCFFFAV